MSAGIRVAAFVEEFDLRTPAQQLVDRFLLGIMRDGRVEPPRAREVALVGCGGLRHELIDRRTREQSLVQVNDVRTALRSARGVLVVPRGLGEQHQADLAGSVIDNADPGATVFVHGTLEADARSAAALAKRAASREVTLFAGSYMGTTWRLPSVGLDFGAKLKRALVAVVGGAEASFLGIDGLLPIVERRGGGESGVRSVTAVLGDDVWKQQDCADLLAAAISRSNSPQGDPQKDGRTQDLVGLGLMPKLATDPVLFRLAHNDGLVSYVVNVSGVVNDINFAVETTDGEQVSAQIYRPPHPYSEEWTSLAGVVGDAFVGGKAPWPIERSILTAGIMSALRRARQQPGRAVATPELKVAYTGPRDAMFWRT